MSSLLSEYESERFMTVAGQKPRSKAQAKRIENLRKQLKIVQQHGKKTHLSFVTAKIRFQPYRQRYLRASKDPRVKLHKGFMSEYEELKRPVVRFGQSLKRLEQKAERLIIRIRKLRTVN